MTAVWLRLCENLIVIVVRDLFLVAPVRVHDPDVRVASRTRAVHNSAVGRPHRPTFAAADPLFEVTAITQEDGAKMVTLRDGTKPAEEIP